MSSKFPNYSELYSKIISPILSKDSGIDAEIMSQLSLQILEKLAKNRNKFLFKSILSSISKEFKIKDPRLEQRIFECKFENPVGLAAGFDKNAVGAGVWDVFGFGFAEVGTVTLHKQFGNPKPRLFRLAKEQAALNRMGFNNNGAAAMREKIESQKLPIAGQRETLIGINLGKSKIADISDANNDYSSSLKLLASLGDYAVINVSSPNTVGLRDLQEPYYLNSLIKSLKDIPKCPPLLVKIAPDLNDKEINSIVDVALDNNLAGIIAINTSIDRFELGQRKLIQTGKTLSKELGGLSGVPIRKRAIEVIKRLYKHSEGNLPLIGVGGIDSDQAAWERIVAGASLVQIYTGWIFNGPNLVPQILKGLIKQLDKHGFKNISEAVGTNAPWI
tara:strand:- start:88 stop:1254 length:1167 start_codon:yes stop_codon:yes gene_type:complete